MPNFQQHIDNYVDVALKASLPSTPQGQLEAGIYVDLLSASSDAFAVKGTATSRRMAELEDLIDKWEAEREASTDKDRRKRLKRRIKNAKLELQDLAVIKRNQTTVQVSQSTVAANVSRVAERRSQNMTIA